MPFSDLHVLLEHQPKRVLLSREEYNDLVKKAQKAPDTHAPQPALLVAADYAVTVAQQRALIKGVLSVEVLESGLQTVRLDLGSVGLQDAKLDNRNATIGRGDGPHDDGLVLFVDGVGRHELVLDMVAPVDANAARQTSTSVCRVPLPPRCT